MDSFSYWEPSADDSVDFDEKAWNKANPFRKQKGIMITLRRFRSGTLAIVRPRKCSHLKTRCTHGDEITARMKVYSFRFWKQPVIRRQICMYCGKALNRIAICTATGKDQHVWIGPWPEQFIVSEY